MAVFDAVELPRIQSYLENKFGSKGFALKMRERATDSVEVLLNAEFIGLLYKDDEDGGISYNFNMAILEEDV